jgi:hypothetical protein
VLLLVAGCASSRPPVHGAAAGAHPRSAAPPVTAEELTAPQGHLVLRQLTLKQNGQPGLILEEDGTVRAPNEQGSLGKLQRDGRFVDARGKVLAQLTADGEILDASGEFLPVTIDASGTVKLLTENRVVRLLDDGTLDGASPGVTVTIEGATPETRRTAMFLLVLSGYRVRSCS